MRNVLLPAAAGAMLLLGAAPAWAGLVSPVQSAARPFGLDVLAPVQLAGSDAKAAAFQTATLPVMQSVVNAKLSETGSIGNASSIALDPSKLVLNQSADIRVYFVGEGAGYRNSLGLFTGSLSQLSSGLKSTDAGLVFPDASTSADYLNPDKAVVRNTGSPLASGDFVDLGRYDADTQLNFFAISDGANGGDDVFTGDAAYNPDKFVHFVSLAVPGSSYLLIGVEDLYGGGDKDYNDLVFAVDIGAVNVQKLVSATVPLPPAAWALIAPMVMFGLRRMRRTRAA